MFVRIRRLPLDMDLPILRPPEDGIFPQGLQDRTDKNMIGPISRQLFRSGFVRER
jgi:hypothetical protein